jgi:hypothetical protein
VGTIIEYPLKFVITVTNLDVLYAVGLIFDIFAQEQLVKVQLAQLYVEIRLGLEMKLVIMET